MNTENYQSELIDAFYAESSITVKEIAIKYELPLEKCQKDWDLIEAISRRFQQLPEYQPTQISLNKINSFARERVSELSKKPFWRFFWQPGFAVAVFAVVGVFTFYLMHDSNLPKGGPQVKVSQQTTPASRMNQRLFSTPLDDYPQKNHVFSNVSLGNGQGEFSFDDGLESQFLSKNPTARELELLFFRARKLEKLGYFREALNDYQFIEKFNTDSGYQKAVPLAMARCYEKLGQKNQAISVLENYQASFGSSEDIGIWMDQLKSETF